MIGLIDGKSDFVSLCFASAWVCASLTVLETRQSYAFNIASSVVTTFPPVVIFKKAFQIKRGTVRSLRSGSLNAYYRSSGSK